MASRITFGRFELRGSERTLLVDGAPAPLGARAFDVLAALVERRDRVVTKAELLDLAWPGLVVEENNLSVQISALRKLLGNAAIATVTGRGYRFALDCDGPAGAIDGGGLAVQRMPRRMVAIVGASVPDWIEALEADPQAAVADWRRLRGELIEPSLRRAGGEAIEVTAERMVFVFGSTVDALSWTMDLQHRTALARAQPGGPRLSLRAGVLVEDAIFDDGKPVGDAIHLAERLQRLAPPDGVLATDTVRDFAWQRLPVSFSAHGETLPSNFGRAAQLYRVVADAPRVAQPEAQVRMQLDRRPGIAVLPFDAGIADGPDYFGDGITEEIIAALSLNRALFVIARNSTLRYRGAASDRAHAAAELGVRYVLTGSVRRQASRLRIHAELTDSEVNRVIWVEHFEGTDDDVFGFQAEIAARISAAIDPRVQEAEIERTRRRPTDSFDAYDCVLHGISLEFGTAPGDFERAGELYRRAVALDPRYAQAHAHLAWWFNLRIGEGRSGDRAEDAEMADRHARTAVALEPRDAWVLSMAGHTQSFLFKRFAAAMEMFDQALQINPNCAAAWLRSGTTLAYTNRGDEALQRVRNAMRLSPYDQHGYSFCTTSGIACIVIGRHDEAVVWLTRALRLNPRYRAARRLLVAALALAGEVSEAREIARSFLAEEPGFRVAAFGRWYPLQPPALEQVLDGLRAAQLPD